MKICLFPISARYSIRVSKFVICLTREKVRKTTDFIKRTTTLYVVTTMYVN